jgi:hypothetical protein
MSAFTAYVRRLEKMHRQPNYTGRENRRFAIKLAAEVLADEAADKRTQMQKYNSRKRGTYRAEMRREAK